MCSANLFRSQDTQTNAFGVLQPPSTGVFFLFRKIVSSRDARGLYSLACTKGKFRVYNRDVSSGYAWCARCKAKNAAECAKSNKINSHCENTETLYRQPSAVQLKWNDTANYVLASGVSSSIQSMAMHQYVAVVVVAVAGRCVFCAIVCEFLDFYFFFFRLHLNSGLHLFAMLNIGTRSMHRRDYYSK